MASDWQSPELGQGYGKEGAMTAISSRYRMSEAGFNRFAVLGGVLGGLLLFIFFPASLQLPPISPSLTPEELVTHYRENEAGMRGGIALMLTGGSFWAIYTAGISRQLARIPGINPTVVWAQLGNGINGGMWFMIPAVLFASTIYRLDRDPEVTQLTSDTAWFSFFFVFPPFAAQELLISYGILSDRRPDPLCPHWIAWVNNGFVLGYFPAFGVHCVYRGVLAWNGALNFWVGFVSFAIITFLQTFAFFKAAGKPDRD